MPPERSATASPIGLKAPRLKLELAEIFKNFLLGLGGLSLPLSGKGISVRKLVRSRVGEAVGGVYG